MIRACFASIRIAFALVCVGISLLLSGQWLGLLPDVDHVRTKARREYCEAVGLSAAKSIRERQWTDLEASLATLVDHNDELLSIGVRNRWGRLKIETGRHQGFWESDPSRGRLPQNADSDNSVMSPEEIEFFSEASRERPEAVDDAARVFTVSVPITLNRSPWGSVEFVFADVNSSLIASMSAHSLLPMICFFATAGLFSYTLLMTRILGVFRKTQVVPDRVRKALDTLAEGLLILDDRARIVLANEAFLTVTGCAGEDLTGVAASELEWLKEDDQRAHVHPWIDAIRGGVVASGVIMRYRLPGDEIRSFSVNSAPLGTDGEQRGALVTFRDVTHVEAHRAEQEKMLAMLKSSRDEIRQKNKALEQLATVDSLTSCLNRRAFFERFETLWQTAKQSGRPLSCLMFDNDHFKSVNDTYGHHIGDEVLRRVSRAIRQQYQGDYLVCRYGGEEFCVLLPDTDLETARQHAETTRREIMAIRLDDPAELRLTASIGVSELCYGATDPQTLINQADACLYMAKKNGRNQVVVYQPGMEDDEPTSQPRQEQERRKADMIPVPFQAVTALLGALSYRDSDTAEHSCRVANLCVRIADGLLDQRQIYLLEVAGLLHDIGKIGVPDHVLLKPGRLTEDEWKLMSQHDEIGVSIIDGTFSSTELSQMIRYHHAFFGGGGRHQDMPEGDAIPLGARILTIADSYDAMVSDRIYRKGRSHQEAVQELRACAGTQFDPDLVERFVQRVDPADLRREFSRSGVTKQAALRIGIQIEHIADAIDHRDPEQLRDLAVHIGSLAKSHRIDAMAETAESIESLAVNTLERNKQLGRETPIDEDEEWIDLLRQTNELLSLCRTTQSVYVGDTSDRNRAVIEGLVK